jgi:hypothetical protein
MNLSTIAINKPINQPKPSITATPTEKYVLDLSHYFKLDINYKPLIYYSNDEFTYYIDIYGKKITNLDES